MVKEKRRTAADWDLSYAKTRSGAGSGRILPRFAAVKHFSISRMMVRWAVTAAESPERTVLGDSAAPLVEQRYRGDDDGAGRLRRHLALVPVVESADFGELDDVAHVGRMDRAGLGYLSERHRYCSDVASVSCCAGGG